MDQLLSYTHDRTSGIHLMAIHADYITRTVERTYPTHWYYNAAVKPNSRNYTSTAVKCWHGLVQCCLLPKCLPWCRSVRTVQYWSRAKVSVCALDTLANDEMSWIQSVLTPFQFQMRDVTFCENSHKRNPLFSVYATQYAPWKFACNKALSPVAVLDQGAPGQMTWLEDPPSWLRPAYCFDSVILWTEKMLNHIWMLSWFYFDKWNNQQHCRPVFWERR